MAHMSRVALLLASCLALVLSESLNVCEYLTAGPALSPPLLPSDRHGRWEQAGGEWSGHGHQIPDPEQHSQHQQEVRPILHG